MMLAIIVSISLPSPSSVQAYVRTYENEILGLTLQYPHSWNINAYDRSECIKFDTCYLILVTPPTSASVISIRIQNLSSIDLFACVCKSLSDYVAWNYKWNDNYKKVSLLNENQTTVGSNHVAWQAEVSKNSSLKSLLVFTTNVNLGYIFDYSANDANMYSQHLSDFKSILSSIKFLSGG